MIGHVITVALLLAAGFGAPGQQAHAELAGMWQRDDSRGARNYWMGEYPEMTLEITLAENAVHVRQALGSVRDGVTQPGSGERFYAYTLITDGERREIESPTASRREASARWGDTGLDVQLTMYLGGRDGSEPIVVEMDERWRVTDRGATLEIHRVVRMTDREPREATVVFGRVR